MKKHGSLAWMRSLGRIGRQAVRAAHTGGLAWGRVAKRTGTARAATALALPGTAKSPKPPKLPKLPKLPKAPKPSGPAAAAHVPTTAKAPGRWTTGVAGAAGTARRWRLFTPAGLLPGERPPLLVLLHGCRQDAAGIAAVTGLHRLAARERFLLLLPEQDRLANAQGCWNWFDTGRAGRPGRAQAEADAVLAAIDQACARRADRQRVVVAGLSAGAGLAALLALRHPQRVAGVVMHSGVPPGKARSTADALRAMRGCAAPAPLDVPTGVALPPLLVIHGSLDGIVAPSNGHAAVQVWAAACGASARPTRRIQRGRRHALLWTDHACGRRVVASLAIVQGGGHAWSGGAAGLKFSDPKGPDASRLVWAFARRVFGLVGSRGAGFGSAGFGSAQPATTVG